MLTVCSGPISSWWEGGELSMVGLGVGEECAAVGALDDAAAKAFVSKTLGW